MSTQAPSFPLSKLTTETDRGVTNAVDSVYVLEFLYRNTVDRVMTSKNRVCYALRAGPEERQFLPSENANDPQALIGRLDDGHRMNFVITSVPRKGISQSELKSLHAYFTFPVLGTVRVRSASNLVDDNGNSNTINFSFGPHLSGSATVKFSEDQKANVTYQYTAMGKQIDENSVDVSLSTLPLPPFNN